MSGNLLVRFDEGRVGRTARSRLLSYSTVKSGFPEVQLRGPIQLRRRHLRRASLILAAPSEDIAEVRGVTGLQCVGALQT